MAIARRSKQRLKALKNGTRGLSMSNAILRHLLSEYCVENGLTRRSLGGQISEHGVSIHHVQSFLRDRAAYNPSPRVAAAIAKAFAAVSGDDEIIEIYRDSLLRELGLEIKTV